jgi:hypothetical protein
MPSPRESAIGKGYSQRPGVSQIWFGRDGMAKKYFLSLPEIENRSLSS